ncbi:PaaI family thioesterase [Shewanella sp. OMA3-2]|uniref:PaaI family thioesterase n=1 Tax=Shewanella sp. OMA3-2 TaxID=2908650 RepID=UPI001F15CCF3|nr:PaaI family thioesterase [Shewanella sp. OMA3-2]UJF20573.1 PaaI family thioesterase [Shewanella sp. OMA3-2]
MSLAMMDFVIYRAIGDELTHDKQFATIQLNTNFLAAVKLGDIVYGRGRIQRSTRSVIFAEGELYTESRSTMQGTGIWKVLGAK